jgi:hypothetical protein
MNKNNSKTINERTHNSMDLYRKSGNILNEEFSKDFNTKIDTKKNAANHTGQLTTKSSNKV